MPTQVELEERLIYAVIVAGKAASFADKATEALYKLLDGPTPLLYLAKLHYADIENLCRAARTGAYRKIARSLHELSRNHPDLVNCLPEGLEKYYGIGMKTSRFFIVWTRPEARYAVLDTHILRWMRQRGVWTPDRSPRYRNTYERLESIFIKHADSLGLTPRQLDWKIWSENSLYKGTIQSGPRIHAKDGSAGSGELPPGSGDPDPKRAMEEGHSRP